ncbi:glycosyltransferase [Echinicola sp. CAU 1574]|uniref:Glycosyltransferase n=1 Tax=Echinicola arenosa TaxID=2774144 RepID=A0ABR9AR34_9BACT|nr:glycosyltransferase family 2 protein [Echinicola arenosa]MBD8490084.1 glycosyltransferase [Echinicola arenosa]
MYLSIVTINYNNLNGLKDTFKSIKSQKNVSSNDYEYLVIDGLSNDGSQELIKEFELIDNYLIEADQGIADAFNKGIKKSRGKYLLFLNSGDSLLNEHSLLNVIEALKNSQADILVKKVAMVDENNNILYTIGKEFNISKQRYRNYLPHQGMLIRRDLFQQYGLYDISYRLGMDYEWSIRVLKQNPFTKIEFMDECLSRMAVGGVSQTNFKQTFLAYHRARMKNGICNPVISLISSNFFIIRRSIGLLIRGYKKGN